MAISVDEEQEVGHMQMQRMVCVCVWNSRPVSGGHWIPIWITHLEHVKVGEGDGLLELVGDWQM